MSVERCTYPADAKHAPLLRALLALDGSTTRVCEALAQAPVQVQLIRQHPTRDVPDAVRRHIGGQEWLLRVTALHAHGRVMMDNLSFIRSDAVPEAVLRGLKEGVAPIGHLLQPLFVRRETVSESPQVEQALWEHVGFPDARASRCYRIVTASGPLMLIFEVFREGMVQAQ